MRASVASRARAERTLSSRPGCTRAAAPAPRLPPQRRLRVAKLPVAAAAEPQNGARSFEAVEARLGQWVAALSHGGAAGTASRVQSCLLGLLVLLQRLVRWVQVAVLALQVQAARQQAQPQLAFAGAAGAGGAPSSSGASSSSSGDIQLPASAAAAAETSGPQAAPSGGSVMDFISGAATGAVEQLRHTLTDATEGMESKWSVIEQTASSVQGALFQAAQAHSEAVRSNPQVSLWKQPSVEAVISEEEKVYAEVYAKVYAELLQKDNKSLGFQAQP